jgi:uncharacterized damage-inducible protein DinB
MSLSESLLPEFDQETALTRKCLQVVPTAKLGWQPHPKSMTLGQLSGFCAVMLTWTGMTIAQDSLDLDPPGGQQRPQMPTTAEQILAMFDANVVSARLALQGADDARLRAPWTLMKAGEKILTLPRIAILRSYLLNHLIHHRGQLTVYLRLLDVPVPTIYGPTADDPSWS